MKKINTAVILAGGMGTRLEEETRGIIPKPMVTIGNVPILELIIEIYAIQGCKHIIIAAGFMREVIDAWGAKYINNDIDNLTIVNTGEATETGGRLKRLKNHLTENENFFLTYGDGLGNVNISRLETFHKLLCQSQRNTLATLTAVHPPARFGALQVQAGFVTEFAEKRQITNAYINGGFYIINSQLLDIIEGDNTRFEFDILPTLAQQNKLGAFAHTGYWQMMDTPRNRRQLERDYAAGKPWLEGLDK